MSLFLPYLFFITVYTFHMLIFSSLPPHLLPQNCNLYAPSFSNTIIRLKVIIWRGQCFVLNMYTQSSYAKLLLQYGIVVILKPWVGLFFVFCMKNYIGDMLICAKIDPFLSITNFCVTDCKWQNFINFRCILWFDISLCHVSLQWSYTEFLLCRFLQFELYFFFSFASYKTVVFFFSQIHVTGYLQKKRFLIGKWI